LPRRLEPILAGGGIVAGVTAGEIAIVRRRRYPGEIGLPKGKVKTAAGETIVRAAEREVAEEIGYPVRAVDFAGITHYFAKIRPKVVFYYHMTIVGEGGPIDAEEIEAVAWLTPAEAVARLTHAEDRRLVAALFALPD
jgi:8-oxo-dGTP diphosphatase